MISSLRGKINRIWGNWIEVEVNGVGYEVQISITNYELRIGEEIRLYIFMSVSENNIGLFGFKTVEELDLFKMLITVSGVGPKTAAQILGNTESLAIVKAIGEADVDFFKKIKGIGLKTAQRIIVDLKSKIGGLGELNLKSAFADGYGETTEDDVVLSLKQLGFERKEIDKVVKRIPAEIAGTEDRLSWCLQNIGK